PKEKAALASPSQKHSRPFGHRLSVSTWTKWIRSPVASTASPPSVTLTFRPSFGGETTRSSHPAPSRSSAQVARPTAARTSTPRRIRIIVHINPKSGPFVTSGEWQERRLNGVDLLGRHGAIDPRFHLLIQHRQGHRAVAQHRVVEGLDVEVGA